MHLLSRLVLRLEEYQAIAAGGSRGSVPSVSVPSDQTLAEELWSDSATNPPDAQPEEDAEASADDPLAPTDSPRESP